MDILNIFELRYIYYLLVALLLITISVSVDLYTGIQKAKAKKEAITSGGYRQTIRKLLEYWAIQIVSFTIDLLLCITGIGQPYFLMLCSIAVVVIEIKSIFENLRERRSSAAQITDIISAIVNASDNEKAKKLIETIKKL